MSTSLPLPLLICVVGPTAIGKTALAIKIAQELSTEIISADSRQFFKEMNIGTAVPSKEELACVPHHFIQHKSICNTYSVGDFEKDGLLLLDQLYKKHSSVILVGGSGLYINALTKGLNQFPSIPKEIRKQLVIAYQKKGIRFLQEQLQKADPTYYAKVDLQNHHRLIRALEVCKATKKPFSSFLSQKLPSRNFKTLFIGLNAEREILYNRINSRVDTMIQKGLLEEAEKLYSYRHLNALQTVGYKELFSHFDGTIDLPFAVSEIKKNTRRFSKRQLTWFKKSEETHWFDYKTKSQEIIEFIYTKK